MSTVLCLGVSVGVDVSLPREALPLTCTMYFHMSAYMYKLRQDRRNRQSYIVAWPSGSQMTQPIKRSKLGAWEPSQFSLTCSLWPSYLPPPREHSAAAHASAAHAQTARGLQLTHRTLYMYDSLRVALQATLLEMSPYSTILPSLHSITGTMCRFTLTTYAA